MRIGVITGSGSYDWPSLDEACERTVATEFGDVTVTEGRIKDAEVVHLSRHGAGHHRLSHQVEHRANLAALLACHVQALVSFTVCGAVDLAAEPGSLVVFDDLYFPSNRLPDGSPCTWYDTPGAPGRGHWIFEAPFSEPLRQHLIAAAAHTGAPVLARGTYGHVDGPRFNSRSEIAALARAGVTAVSQTAGPEVVLAGEAELPMALVGYVTDYANGVAPAPEPVEALLARMASSTQVFTALAEHALPGLDTAAAAGFVYRFDA
ncbi:MTAP family purine nucleoside phosphorylase [Streptomyces sp. H10-C2]|uniref:MTAP family purine nucleoside phosphorylase n=1 Tax=unclassified Streptomyces TaxID=2593676 RepID=UPI0024B8EDC9|nr:MULTISPECIES: MTAP family purine nucleoside phosphorylase [unclassified Streptomyces]MDJ0346587.1 MTAP family purine nucleoside phosphorylase [Streptomyces sp. PH10-H1]MDJ0375040.1 MTAP family purine nucleoside phosphorylase [Streptomyces sp. H10-C2]